MKFIFLTESFYKDYYECKEIEQKTTRPYAEICVKIGNLMFAIPLRSGIKHPHAFWTNKDKHCGLDFSKAVVIKDLKYISGKRPHIRQDEYRFLINKEYIIKQKMIKYIIKYKKARLNLENKRNKTLCKYSTMQYFEDCIENINDEYDLLLMETNESK